MFADGGLDKNYVPSTERGVVFLSSIPSNMRPSEVRLHLQQYGTIFRTKFTAFPKKERSSGSGIMPLQFKNGYVEFMKKEDAIRCAETLNGQMVATKKRRKSHGQLWNIRFMEGFAMGDLAEEREEHTRNKKELEHRIKEREKSSNELFRQMVQQKKQAAQQQTQQRQLTSNNAESVDSQVPRPVRRASGADRDVEDAPAERRTKRDRSEARRATPVDAEPVSRPSKKSRDEVVKVVKKKRPTSA